MKQDYSALAMKRITTAQADTAIKTNIGCNSGNKVMAHLFRYEIMFSHIFLTDSKSGILKNNWKLPAGAVPRLLPCKMPLWMPHEGGISSLAKDMRIF